MKESRKLFDIFKNYNIMNIILNLPSHVHMYDNLYF